MRFVKKIAKITTDARKNPVEKKLTWREKWESWKEFAQIVEAIKVAAEKGESSCRVCIEYVVNMKRFDTLGFIVDYVEKKEKPYRIEIDWDFAIDDDEDDDWFYDDEEEDEDIEEL